MQNMKAKENVYYVYLSRKISNQKGRKKNKK